MQGVVHSLHSTFQFSFITYTNKVPEQFTGYTQPLKNVTKLNSNIVYKGKSVSVLKPFKHSGRCMYHILQRAITVHFSNTVYLWDSSNSLIKLRMFPY